DPSVAARHVIGRLVDLSHVSWRTCGRGSAGGSHAAPRLRCRIEPYLDQGGALRAPRAGACARPPPWEAPPARAGPGIWTPQINSAHPATQCRVLHEAVFLVARLSSSQAPRLDRSLRSRRCAMASPA